MASPSGTQGHREHEGAGRPPIDSGLRARARYMASPCDFPGCAVSAPVCRASRATAIPAPAKARARAAPFLHRPRLRHLQVHSFQLSNRHLRPREGRGAASAGRRRTDQAKAASREFGDAAVFSRISQLRRPYRRDADICLPRSICRTMARCCSTTGRAFAAALRRPGLAPRLS